MPPPLLHNADQPSTNPQNVKPEADPEVAGAYDYVEQRRRLEIEERQIEVEAGRQRARTTRWAINVGVAIGFVSLVSVLWHYLAPTAWHWMADEQIVMVRDALGVGGWVYALKFVLDELR